ncbi:hypothetical protein BGZ98_003586, partial [Dissophora globulifera]
MKAQLQILSAGTADCPPSVVVSFDGQRYLINCGEGTQRLCMETRFRFSKIKTLLFTRTHWDCMGGAPGMLLTLSDTGTRNMTVLGGENLTHAIASMRQFMYRECMAVNSIEFNKDNKTFKDENLRVTAVQVYPDNYVRASPYQWPEGMLYNPPYDRNNNNNGSAWRPQEAQPAAAEAQAETTDAPLTAPAATVDGVEDAAPVTAGRKRSSDNLQSVAVVDEDPDRDQKFRRDVVSRMFNVNAHGGSGHPLPAKKAKRDGCEKPPSSTTTGSGGRKGQGKGAATAETAAATGVPPKMAMTDVDMIEATRQLRRSMDTRNHDLPRTSPNLSAISYIFQSPDYAGKFNPQAAIALGLSKGPAFRELVAGNPVTTEKGDVVYPHQVISGGRPGRVFMVIDCPGPEYLSSLMSAKEFEQYQSSGSDALKAACIVHLGGHAIVSHPDYKAWMQRFGSGTQHIIAHEDYCGQKLVWKRQATSSYKLSKLDPSIFPVPYFDDKPTHDLQTDLAGLTNVKAQVAESMLSFSLEPTTGWDRTDLNALELADPLLPFHDHEVAKEKASPYMLEYYGLAEKANAEIEKELKGKKVEFPGSEVELTALGTGSSHPGKYRNVSATLLDMPGDGTFFLDVGEGSFGQMFRQFGGYKRSADQVNSVEDRIKRLKGIFISHLHADHHLGTIGILDRWNKLRAPDSEPLYLIAPSKFNTFLREMSDVQDFGYKNVEFIECDNILYSRNSQDPRRKFAQQALAKMCAATGFKEIQSVDVIHCLWAYGLSLEHKDGWKLVYSGDTRPSNNLVDAGQNATVLLHEATFEDDKWELAQLKRHSTTEEAIMVGEGMQAKFTMLTHFSQRYPKIPAFDYEDKSTIIGICFDLMSV